MKLSKSKLALAKVINENGGWVDGEAIFAAMDGNGDLFGYSGRPQWTVSHGHWYGHTLTCWFFSPIVINNHHQTILSCEEYYQAYPKADADGWIEWKGGMKSPVESGVPVDVKTKDGNEHYDQLLGDACWHNNWGDANIIAYRLSKPEVKPEFCDSVMRSIPEPSPKPTIEQLAQDYRNKLDFANSKQHEADDAKVAADAALGELERAGEALGLLIGIAKQDREPELVIADWRDLRVNDVIFVGEYDDCESGEYVVVWLEDSDYDGDYAVMVVGIDGIERCMDTAMEWRFIRRP